MLLASTHESQSSMGPVSIQGDLEIPENFEEKKQLLSERDQVIPMEATKTTSPGAFGGKVLEYHLADIIDNNKFKPLESVKSLEKTMNKNTQVDSDLVKIKSKVDLNRLKAEMDIQTFVNAKIWTENSFKTLRSQMKLYELEDGGLISIENKANNEDTRTYLNLEKTW